MVVRYESAQHIESVERANTVETLKVCHQWMRTTLHLLRAPSLISVAKVYIAVEALWAAANTSTKISIVHFYITIFRSNKTFLKFAYAVMCFVSAFGVAVIITDLLSCRPLSKIWDPLQPGVCENIIKTLIAHSSCNMAIDFIIILLPMTMLWRLQMATYRKIELTIIFALGFMYVIQQILLRSLELILILTAYALLLSPV